MPLVRKPKRIEQPKLHNPPPWADYTKISHPHLFEIDPITDMPYWMIRDVSKHPVQEAEASEPE